LITCSVLLLLAIELCGQQMHKIDWLAHLVRGGEIDGIRYGGTTGGRYWADFQYCQLDIVN
jgi:hypothetical protein